MTKFANRAKMSISSTGTGNVTLNAAVAGYRTFAAAGIVDTDVIRYIIEDANGAWEIGVGLMSSSATVMARTVEESSNSNAALNLTSAAKVLIGLTSGDLGSKVYATISDLVAVTGMVVGDMAMVNATKKMYMYTASGWWFIATLTNTAPTSISGANASYALASDGTATTVTLTSTDPEGFPITFSHAVTTGSLGSTATITQNNNVFTITPSTNSAHEGSFSLTFSASDGNSVSQAVSAFTLSFGYDLANGSYDSKSFAVYDSGNSNTPYAGTRISFSHDGTKMFYASGAPAKGAVSFTLSTAWDVSTAGYAATFDPTQSNYSTHKILFNANGTKMFILDPIKIWEYSLSTAYDLTSTITYSSNSYSLSNTPLDAAFSADGTRLFVLHYSTNTITQYNLSTGFDLSTVSTTSNSYDHSSQSTDFRSFALNPAGTKLFTLVYTSGSSRLIHHYSLSSGWDASTISYTSSTYDPDSDFGSSFYIGHAEGITFSPSGHKMYIMNDTSLSVHQYSTVS